MGRTSAPARISGKGVYRTRRARVTEHPRRAVPALFTKPFWLYMFATMNAGAVTDEQGFTLNSGTGTTTLAYQTTTKRSGRGALKWTGGTCTAGEFSMAQASPWSANTQKSLWIGMAFMVESLHSTADLLWIMGMNIMGTSGGSSVNKPTLKLKNDGKVYLGNSANTNDDTLLATIETGVWYYAWLHGVTSNGSDGLVQEAYLFDGNATYGGPQLAYCSKAWDVSNGGGSDAMKWLGGTTQDSTGLVIYGEDFASYLGTVCPGPLIGVSREPTSVTAAGNFSATGAADIPTAVTNYPNDGDTSYASAASATASSLVLGLSTPTLQAEATILTVMPRVQSKHPSALPTVTYGVRSGGVDWLVDDYPNSSTAYASRSGRNGGVIDGYACPFDPATGVKWSRSAALAFDGVVRDADAVNREIRVTSIAWDVVAVLGGAGTPSGQPTVVRHQYIPFARAAVGGPSFP